MIRRAVSVMGKKAVYWEDNPEASHAIVMLHGFRGNHLGLVATARQLAGYRVILPDRPGYGESEPLDIEHSLPNYATWLDEFVDALHLANFTTWGHSYSGSIAMIHATERANRPKAVVSVSLAAIRRGPLRWITTGYYRSAAFLPTSWRRPWLTSKTVERTGDRFLFRTSEQRHASALQRDIDRPTLRVDIIRQEYFSALRLNLDRYAAVMDVPMLVIAGARDLIVPVRRLQDLVGLIRNGTLVILPDHGHMAPVEDPDLSAKLTSQYLDRILH